MIERASPASIVTELAESGKTLWSSVHCGVQHSRYVIYAELLCANGAETLTDALRESKRIVSSVLERRIGRNWLATVHWSGRVSYTFAPDPAGVSPRSGAAPTTREARAPARQRS